MVFLSKWALEHGFVSYLNEQENIVLTNLKADLENYFANEGSWDSIVQDRKLWRSLLIKHKRRYFELKENSGKKDFLEKKLNKPIPIHGGILRRIRLLDHDRSVLIGFESKNSHATEQPLLLNDKVVGYISLNPTTEIRDELDLSFTKHLIRTIQYSALGVLIISLFMAYWLARQFVVPIKKLAVGTRELAAGNFTTRFSVDSKDELGQLAHESNILATTLESNEASRKQWIADISHELRTPLTVLRGEIEAIKDGVHALSPKLIDSLYAEILHIQTLVNDLYELSLSDVGALSYKKSDTNVCTVLNEAIDFYTDEFESRKIEIRFENKFTSEISIFADANRLHQLFSNLLANSLRYTDAGGVLAIELSNDAEEVKIDFYDSGPSVAPQDMPKLFERLYRVEDSRNRKKGGAGLGLSICQNIVVAHQGSIKASQSKLGGLHIHIVLPRNAHDK